MKLLDLYCGAGGASMGYHRAGFEVTGVDINPQPRYPFTFVRADALEYLHEHGREYDVVTGSPPCRDHTPLTSVAGFDGTGWLLAATREGMTSTGRPWVIENVPGAPMRADVKLCGCMFDLRTYRVRWFEMSDPLFWLVPAHKSHRRRTSTKKLRKCFESGMNISVTGDVGRWVGEACMGIDWMDGNELSQAIPPAYTEFIGEQLMHRLSAVAS